MVKTRLIFGVGMGNMEAAHRMDHLMGDVVRLREFCHGAHLATENENSSVVLHMICHKLDELMNGLKEVTHVI